MYRELIFGKIKNFLRKEFGVIRVEYIVVACIVVVVAAIVIVILDDSIEFSFQMIKNLYPVE